MRIYMGDSKKDHRHHANCQYFWTEVSLRLRNLQNPQSDIAFLNKSVTVSIHRTLESRKSQPPWPDPNFGPVHSMAMSSDQFHSDRGDQACDNLTVDEEVIHL